MIRREERLSHFKCDKCRQAFAVVEAPVNQVNWFCPWCGERDGIGLTKSADTITGLYKWAESVRNGPMEIAESYYLIIDVEATCSQDDTVPRHEMEIIEIGAVLLNSETFCVDSRFSTFVRPSRHPKLTEFCKTLTSITQEQVDHAPWFPNAIKDLKKWLANSCPTSYLFCSWGDYDKSQFLQDCQYHKVDYPFGPPHVHMNLKREFANFKNRKPCGVTEALRHLGMTFVGKLHRGKDDAENMARIVQRVCTGS